ncbi:hypothetical protein CWO91_27200 [Bradyrhizobium genosp. SA-3]|nr:hypothetical protein CWO91_27200 [Bradyrhizobium genosp. SA-3]
MCIRSRMCRWLIAAIVGGSLLAVGPASAQRIPTDEPAFTAFVAARINAVVRNTQVVIKGPLTLSIGPLQANLDRIYAFCKANTSGCAKEIETYVGGVVATTGNVKDAPTKAALRIVVRSTDYMRQALRELESAGTIPTRPLAEGLVIVPVLDSPRTVRIFNDKDRAALGLTSDQVFDIAIANVRSSLKPLMSAAKPAVPGQVGTLKGDYYATSRLALIDSWAPLAQAQDGVLIVAVPTPDLVLYSGEDSSAALDALRTLAQNVVARAPKPLSGALLRWTPKGWQSVR